MRTIQQKTNKNYTIRSPKLQTVLMVEEFIKENSGEFKKTGLLDRLPRKVIWNKFQIIIRYLEESYRSNI